MLSFRAARRLDRLIDLSKAADERSYLELLVRAGTPAEREALGITVARAVGQWQGDADAVQTKIEIARNLTPEEREKLTNGGPKVVAVWRQEDGSPIGYKEGDKFTSVERGLDR